MSRVSILIPAFNAGRFITATLASACAQSERDLEILVIDDGSSDDTPTLVQAAALADKRIRLLRTPRNGGPSAARNLGLEAAVSEWIALLDADDAMAPERISTLIALAQIHGADMASDNILLVAEDGSTPSSAMIPESLLGKAQSLGLAEFIVRNVGSPKYPRVSYGFMKPIIRREFLNRHAIRYDEHVRFAEDFALYVQCLRAGATWWITPEPMYHYLVRPQSLTEVQSAADLDRLRSRQRALLDHADVRSDLALQAAILSHLDVIDRDYYYRAFTDAVKARRLAYAARLFSEGPRSARLISLEALRQTPIILGKALRGGYARRRSIQRPLA